MKRRPRIPKGATTLGYALDTDLMPNVDDTIDTGAIRWAVLRDKISEHLAGFPEARDALFTAMAKDLGIDPNTRIQI